MAYRIRWTREQQKQFAKRWLEFRQMYGVTQQVMASELGIHVNTCNRIERAKFIPRNETVLKFAEMEKKYKDGWDRERSLMWTPGDVEI